MSSYEIASLIISVTGTLIIGGSLTIAIFQLKVLIKSHKDNHEWNRRIETQKAIVEVRNIDIQKLNEVFGFKYRKEPMPLSEITSKFESDWLLERQCINLLNAYENLASGIKLGIYDEDVVAINRKGAMQRTYTKFKMYIEHIRHHTKKTTYQELQQLIDKWDAKDNYTPPKSPIGK